MDSDWQIVLTADGAVLSAAGGAPSEWAGTKLVDRTDVPEDVRAAAQGLLRELHRSVHPLATARLTRPATGIAVQLLAIEAIPLRRAATDTVSLLESAVETMRTQARAIDVSLKLQVDESVPRMISVDADKVAWIITTLIGNALRYVRHGSRVLPGGSIAVRAVFDAAQSEVTIAVEDDGPGIPDTVLPFLFERRPGGQLTLGFSLKVASDIVAAHGGRLAVESQRAVETSGTTVRLSFPALS